MEIPEVALREVVVNAACHRDYFEYGANIMIEMFDNRAEISNPGGLPKGLNPKQFGKKSVARNSLISSLLHRRGYIEKMGTGINRIKEALKEENAPEPVFDFDTFFTVTFERPQIKSSPKPSEKTVVKILELIGENPKITTKQLGYSIGLSRRGIEWNIDKLKKDGKIMRIGSPKGGHWRIIGK